MLSVTTSSLPEPPRWAQILLEGLLPADRVESVSGDLIEEYRDAVLPRRGRTRADRWYVRQVLGFLWRLCAPFAAIIAVAVVLRTLVDAFVPVDGSSPRPYEFRSAVTTYSALLTYVAAGCYAAFRTGSVSTGVMVTLFSHAAGHLIAIGLTILLFAVAIAPNPTALAAFQITGGWSEGLGLPVAILPLANIAGWAGAVAGKLLFRVSRRPVAS